MQLHFLFENVAGGPLGDFSRPFRWFGGLRAARGGGGGRGGPRALPVALLAALALAPLPAQRAVAQTFGSPSGVRLFEWPNFRTVEIPFNVTGTEAVVICPGGTAEFGKDYTIQYRDRAGASWRRPPFGLLGECGSTTGFGIGAHSDVRLQVTAISDGDFDEDVETVELTMRDIESPHAVLDTLSIPISVLGVRWRVTRRSSDPLPEGATWAFNAVLGWDGGDAEGSLHIVDGETIGVPLIIGGSATRGVDYRLRCKPVPGVTCDLDSNPPRFTFTSGEGLIEPDTEHVGTVMYLDAIEDNTAEGTESLNFTSKVRDLRRPSGIAIVDAPSSVNVGFTLSTFARDEDGGVFQGTPLWIVVGFVLNTPAGRDIEVPLIFTPGTAVEGAEYQRVPELRPGGKTVFPGGQRSHLFNVPYSDDDVPEPDETIGTVAIDTANLPSWVTPASITTTTLLLRDDDGPAPTGPVANFASVTPVTLLEGLAPDVNLEVKVNPAPSADITLRYTVGGSASPGFDYAALPGTLAVPMGATSASIPLPLFVEDLSSEGDETLILTLKNGPGYHVGAPGSRSLTIRDGESRSPRVLASATGLALVEGDLDGSYTLVLRSDPGNATVTVTPRSRDAGAVSVSGPLTFTGGIDGNWATPQSVTVSPLQDDDGEHETVTIFHEVRGYPGVPPRGGPEVTVTVADDEAPPVVSIAQLGGAVTEGGTALFRVAVLPAPESALSVSLSVSENGVGGRDFVAPGDEGARTLTIPALENSASYSVPTVADSADEPDGSVTVTLAAGQGYALGEPVSATLVVRDDDSPPPGTPVAAFASAASRADERAGSLEIEIALDPAPAAPLGLAYTLGGSAESGADYRIAGSGRIAVAAGATRAAIEVAIVDDSLGEPAESVTLALSAGPGYSVGDPGIHTLTLVDDDGPAPLPALALVGGAAVTEGGSALFTLGADVAPTSDVTVNLALTQRGDFAVPGSLGARSVRLASGQRIVSLSVATVDDGVNEPDGRISATLVAGNGYSVASGGATASVAVADDDGPAPPDATE